MRKSIHTNDYATFLELLRDLRERQGVLQVELAKRLKAPQSYVSKCENGERRLDVIELRNWCAALDVSFRDFSRELDKALAGRQRKGGR